MTAILTEVKSVIATTFDIPIDRVAADGSGQTIEQWDSVGHLNLVMALEQKFGVSFTMDEILHLRDVQAVCQAIAEKGGKPTPPMNTSDLKIHHLGVATADMAAAQLFYQEVLGFELEAGPFDDPIQKVRVCFLRRTAHDDFVVELISPLDSTSPVNGYLLKGLGAYHVCYEVADLEKVQAEMRARKCLPISSPAPAVAFEGRRIAWWFTPTKHLIELVESSQPVVAVT